VSDLLSLMQIMAPGGPKNVPNICVRYAAV